MIAFFKSIYLQPRFFYIAVVIAVTFVLAFIAPAFMVVGNLFLGLLFVVLLTDILLLYLTKKGIRAKRICNEKFSNGDQNTVTIHLKNRYSFRLYTIIIDEIPVQFQKRNFQIERTIAIGGKEVIQYALTPTERGEYDFGKLNIYVQSPLKIISRRYVFDQQKKVYAYPSFVQLKKFDFASFNMQSSEYGIHKMRRIGHTMEFEQIKEYTLGDDIRSLNWKASAKRGALMINQYTDEKAQVVYTVIDKGRVMKMPFEGLSLLDYAINATLALSNVVLKKQDKAGMFTFSKNVENMVVAERRKSQMNYIIDALYNIKTDYFESDFGRLYANIKRNITNRSLFILYTNFETLDGLNRQLPYLKAIAKNHLLLVVFFENTELLKLINTPAKTTREVYEKVAAEKFMFEKKLIVNELKKYGIHVILTTPKQLTLNTINKYLELKARGLH